jgi:hypothetical protein
MLPQGFTNYPCSRSAFIGSFNNKLNCLYGPASMWEAQEQYDHVVGLGVRTTVSSIISTRGGELLSRNGFQL